MRSYRFEGIVIKRSDVGEADRLITIFTKSSGKRVFLAKHVRKLNSRRSGSIELFNHVAGLANNFTPELDLLTEVQIVNSYPSWKQSFGRINVAFQLAEAVDKLTPLAEPIPEIFELLKKYFSQIQNLNDTWKTQVEVWLVELIVILGYWPEEKKFQGDIYSFLETTSSRNFYSHHILNRLSQKK